MAYKLFDVVTATKALPESGISAGMTGAIVDVYPDGEVEVEFCNKDGEAIAMLPMQLSQIALLDSAKLPENPE